MPLQPWTRFDNPAMRKIRDEDKRRWKAGPGRDFERYRTDGIGRKSPPDRAFLFSQLGYDDNAPLKYPFGARRDLYRPRAPGDEVAGDFHTIVPGYSEDSVPGKWRMSSPNSPAASPPRQLARRRGSPGRRGVQPESSSSLASGSAAGAGAGAGAVGTQGSGGSLGRLGSKTYWKASMEAAIGALQGS